MKNYNELGLKILTRGEVVEGRNGKTYSLTGESLSFDLQNEFPLLTTKHISTKHIIIETLWYLMGTDSIKFLQENNVKIWNLWADENDSIGPTYGVQWRNFQGSGIDQIQQAIDEIRSGSQSRRIIVNGWAPADLEKMALPPCLVMFQFLDRGDYLDMVVTQRSADFCVGVPYDIAEMGLILTIFSHLTGKQPRNLTINYGDIHIYEEHVSTFLTEQLRNGSCYVPEVIISPDVREIDQLTIDDIQWPQLQGLPRVRYGVLK